MCDYRQYNGNRQRLTEMRPTNRSYGVCVNDKGDLLVRTQVHVNHAVIESRIRMIGEMILTGDINTPVLSVHEMIATVGRGSVWLKKYVGVAPYTILQALVLNELNHVISTAPQ